jgi:uncharacterized protein involved in exopolysaccharide biosynthesis
MTLRHIIQALFERRRFIFLGGGVGLVVGLLWTLFAQPLYQGTAQIVVNVRPPETIGPQSVADQLSSDYLLTQEDIIRSQRVALQVVSRMGPAVTARIAQDAGWNILAGPRDDFVASKLRAGLKIDESAVNSRVISLSYVSHDGRAAADLANAFADAYADVSVDLQADPAHRAAALYDSQMSAIQAKLRLAQSRLAKRSKELGITSGRDQSDADTVRLEALSAQLASAEAASASVGARTVGNALPDTLTSPVIQGMQSELARLEAQRQALSTIAGPNNPDLISINSQIAGLRKQLGQQQALIRQGAATSTVQTSSTVAQLARDVESARARVIASRSNKDEVAVLEQDVKNAQMVYDQMAARKSQLDLLSESGQSNVSILTRASAGDDPIWPRPKILVFGGALLGALISALGILLIEALDRRIRNRAELESWLGIPDLGQVRNSGHFFLETPVARRGSLPKPQHARLGSQG